MKSNLVSYCPLFSFDKEINERSFFGLQGIVKLLAGKDMDMTGLKDSKQPRLNLAAAQAEYYKLKNDVSFWWAQKVYDWQNSKLEWIVIFFPNLLFCFVIETLIFLSSWSFHPLPFYSLNYIYDATLFYHTSTIL